MSYNRKRSDGVEVEIVSLDSWNPDYYQWGKNCANLDFSVEDTRAVLSEDAASNPGVPKEKVDEFWRGYADNKPEN